MRKRYFWKFMMCGAVLSIFISMGGCGKDSATAPSGSTIVINPSEITWDITASACPSALYNYHTIAIAVRDSAGRNMNNADITVELDLSANTGSPPIQVLNMYDGGTLVTSPYHTETGDDGVKYLTVQVDLGCEYKANFNVFSGDAFGSISIETSGA